MYDVKVRLWQRFNAEGNRRVAYDPLEATADKFDLFAGWLLGDPELGLRGRSTDKDLNGFRSAINRYLADAGCGRPLRDDVEIGRTIKVYRQLMMKSKAARGQESDLHRVPCPEVVFLFLLEMAEQMSARDDVVIWVAVFVLQLLGWFRGVTMSGMQPGDVVLTPAGQLLVTVRRMKGRLDMATTPGLMSLPPAAAGSARWRLYRIMRRAYAISPTWYCAVAKAGLSGVKVVTGEDAAATFLTTKLRELTAPLKRTLPKGAVIASHSWREMAAVACFHARYDSLRCACHGFWKDVNTMWTSYIRPYKEVFPYSAFLAEVFDFLRAV